MAEPKRAEELLRAAMVDYRAGRYQSAREQLEALLLDPILTKPIAEQARLLLKDVEATALRHRRIRKGLNDAAS
ncbi:MAG: hypothetical protein IH986_09415 [Planctomycetes bacterium]|nr:hypothetical protein [Planctomycetota bacterium]